MNQCGGSVINSTAGNSAPAHILPSGGRRRLIERKGYTRRAHSRSAYSRKHYVPVRKATVKRSRVSTSRITDRGAPGKWADKNGPGIQVTHPGSLKAVGYSVVAKPSVRHSTLRKAVHKFGPLSTFRKLRAVSTFTKRTSKGRSKKFNADSNWIKKKYM